MLKPWLAQLISTDKIELKLFNTEKPIYIALSCLVSVFSPSSPQFLKCKADIVASYYVQSYWQCHCTSVVTSNALHDALKVLHKCFNIGTCSGFY